MSFRTMSPAAVASLTGETTDEVWLVMLTITHPSLAEAIRVANDNADHVSGGQTFIGLPFTIELPGEDAEEPGVASIQIPNVDREIVGAIRGIFGKARVDIQVALASSPSTIELQFQGMELSDVTWDAAFVRGRLKFEGIVTEPLSLTITPDRFPGLFAYLMGLGLTFASLAPHLGA